MSKSSEYRIELIVRAGSWDRAKTIVAYELEINDKRQTTSREINGLYTVEISLKDVELTDEFYEKILSSQKIAIISDEASAERTHAILKDIYLLEMQFRRLLLHVSDLIEVFYELLTEKAHFEQVQKFAQRRDIVSSKFAESIVSYLTFGEIVSVLGYDLSWSPKPLTGGDLSSLLSEVNSFEQLKKKLSEKAVPVLVWDLIAEHVLEKKVEWRVIQGPSAKVLEYRNSSAHFNVLAPKGYKIAKDQIRFISENLKTRELSHKQQIQLSSIAANYANKIEKKLEDSGTIPLFATEPWLASVGQVQAALRGTVMPGQSLINALNAVGTRITDYAGPSLGSYLVPPTSAIVNPTTFYPPMKLKQNLGESIGSDYEGASSSSS